MNIKKVNLILLTILIVFTVLAFSTATLAQDTAEPIGSKNTALYGLDITADPIGFKNASVKNDPSGSIASIVGKISNYFFGPVTIMFFIVILIGGYQWMIAKGSEEKIAKAKKFIINGIFGMMVVFFAWTLVIVILNALNIATNTG